MVRSESVHRLVLVAVLVVGCGTMRSETAAAQSSSSFPLRLSSNGRYLVDAAGSPFLITGDSPWYILTQPTHSEADEYLDNRRAKGFNAIIVEMIVYSGQDPQPTVTRLGNRPFPNQNSFANPNEAYFQEVDRLVSAAASRGMVVFLAPCWFGWGGLEWWNTIISSGSAQCRAYGQFLGNRYRNAGNIIWVHGGDYSAPSGSTGEQNALQILYGIRDYDTTKIHTMHRGRFSTALQQTNMAPYFDMDATYSGDLTYLESTTAYNRSNFKPTCLIEGRYEGYEPWNNNHYDPPELVRFGAYGPLLSGSTGQIFGCIDLLDFGFTGRPWRAAMDYQGSWDMARLKSLFSSRAWYRLVPDQSHTTVTSGYGTYGGYDYVPAARASDGSFVMAYVSSTGTGSRTLTVNLSRLSGSTSARWFNPTNGVFTTVSGSPFANSGSRSFITPGNNGTGTNDWVLVLESSGTTSYSVSASPSSVAPGGSITASWTAPAGSSATDWIGLYRVGAADTDPVDPTWSTDWVYTNGATSGSSRFTMPNVIGSYELRYFLNNGWTRVATSNTITVTSNVPSLSASPTSVSPGGTVNVGVSDPGSQVRDWVGLYSSSAPTEDGNYAYLLDWRYLNNSKTAPASPISSTTLPFTMPQAGGSYKFRLFANDGPQLLATSATVTVATSGPWVMASPTSVAYGGTVNVSVSDPAPNNIRDWVGLYSASAPAEDGTYVYLLDWKYLNNSTAPPASPISSATVPFTILQPAGSYKFRFFSSGGPQLLATGNTVTVTQ